MEPPEHARSGAPGGSVDPLVGRLLERRYLIGPRIARGGMASVYEATDTRLDRTVAVKVMHPGLGGGDDEDDFARRFVHEARAAARLNHPHVVSVYDQGHDHDTVFLVMEYVPGHTLRDVIRKDAPMPAVRALALLEPLVSALAAAHRAGLIHRDVKPENVLIADQEHGGQIKVADFGLAKAVSADSQHTATSGVLIGTVSYLAPELVSEGRSDARADVYAAGVVLYELLTSAKPHEAESPIQVAYRHVHHDVPMPSLIQPGIPDYVDALVARATSRDPSQRPADASVLLHHIHRVVQALREGLTTDSELAADLMPRAVLDPDHHHADDPDHGNDHGNEVEVQDAETFVAEPYDASALALLTERDPTPYSRFDDHNPNHTAVFDRSMMPPPAHPPAPTTTVGSARPKTARRATRAPSRRSEQSRAPSRIAPVATAARLPTVKGPVALLLAILLAVTIGVGAWWFGWARYTTTPAVLGLDKAAASATLDKSGLDAVVGDPAFSETVTPGLVVATDPKPGGKVRNGGSVTLLLSAGPERYKVPPLEGLTEDEAQDALAATKLAFDVSTLQYSETVPEGQVIKTSPAAGTELKPDAQVNLVLSQGRRPIAIKDWSGKSFDKIRARLEKRGVEVAVTSEEYSESVPEGVIIVHDPTTGTVYSGDTVSFVVSMGPELVEVPSIRGMGVEYVTELLEDLGFEVVTERDDDYVGFGYVWGSDPEAGDEVPRGSTITLYLI